MERNEFNKIIELANAAHEATLKAKAAYAAYTVAAKDAYAAEALKAAKHAYEVCVNSTNFEQSLADQLNRDFSTNFQVSASHPVDSEPAPSYISSVQHVTEPHAPSEIPAAKPLRDLFTMDSEPGVEKNEEEIGWQSRG